MLNLNTDWLDSDSAPPSCPLLLTKSTVEFLLTMIYTSLPPIPPQNKPVLFLNVMLLSSNEMHALTAYIGTPSIFIIALLTILTCAPRKCTSLFVAYVIP